MPKWKPLPKKTKEMWLNCKCGLGMRHGRPLGLQGAFQKITEWSKFRQINSAVQCCWVLFQPNVGIVWNAAGWGALPLSATQAGSWISDCCTWFQLFLLSTCSQLWLGLVPSGMVFPLGKCLDSSHQSFLVPRLQLWDFKTSGRASVFTCFHHIFVGPGCVAAQRRMMTCDIPLVPFRISKKQVQSELWTRSQPATARWNFDLRQLGCQAALDIPSSKFATLNGYKAGSRFSRVISTGLSSQVYLAFFRSPASTTGSLANLRRS